MSEEHPTSYNKIPERKYMGPQSLRCFPTEKPDLHAVRTLRFFLTYCLLRDYGVSGYQSPRLLDLCHLHEVFLKLFQIMCDYSFYANNPDAEFWKAYFKYHFEETVEEIGLPLEIARHMLCCFEWRFAPAEIDRFLEYRTYARSIAEVAEKLYFDRELVIDKVVEISEIRVLLKERLSFVQRIWFERLDGPYKEDYTLSFFGRAHAGTMSTANTWTPCGVRPINSIFGRWNDAYGPFLAKLKLRKWTDIDARCRLRILDARESPGTPKSYWPPKSLPKKDEAATDKRAANMSPFTCDPVNITFFESSDKDYTKK